MKKTTKTKTAAKKKMEKIMREFDHNELRSGARGPAVTSPKQAVTLAHSETRKKSKKK